MVASTSYWLMSSVYLPSAVAGLAAKPFDVRGFADLGAKVLSLAELDPLKNKIDGIPTDLQCCVAAIEVPGSVNVDPSNLPVVNLDKGKCNIDPALPEILNFGSFPVQLSPDLPLPFVVDNNFEAWVADFGLAKLSLELDIQTHVSTHVMGTSGYLALEYASTVNSLRNLMCTYLVLRFLRSLRTSDLVVVDLEHNLITTSEEIPPIPEPEYRFLCGEILKLLHPNVVSIDQMKAGSFFEHALEVAVDHGERIVISILGECS
ncbi:Scytalone dehydratase [Orobanche hederae]